MKAWSSAVAVICALCLLCGCRAGEAAGAISQDPPEQDVSSDAYEGIRRAMVAAMAGSGDVFSADAVILWDATNKETLYEKNADERVFPASTAKLVTAGTALNAYPAETEIVIGNEIKLVNKGSSLCYLRTGSRMTLGDAVSAMLVASGNDAAYTVAVNVARLSADDASMSDTEAVGRFVAMMNDYCTKIGASKSHFVNPDGWDDPEQYSTAGDLLAISLAALKNNCIVNAVSCEKLTASYIGGATVNWENSNKLVLSDSEYYYEYATGLKTGTTDGAGYSLIATAKKNGHELVAVVMHCDEERQRFGAAVQLFDKAFELADGGQ